MSIDIREDDVGTVIEITVEDQDGTVVDLSAATTKQFVFRKPDKTEVTMDAEFVTDGSDGKLKYTIEEDDMNQDGRWSVQVYIVTPAGEWHSTIKAFKVVENLE